MRDKNLFLWLSMIGLALVLAVAVYQVVPRESKTLILATTTSTYDSGLLDYLLPDFEQLSGYDVQVISVGTGQALKTAQAGDADIVLIHAPASELKFVEDGYGVERRCVMYNDFVILGPENDPARVSGLEVVAAMQNIYQSRSEFVSRGDDSGTHKKELELWKAAGLSPSGESDKWYLSVGQGMGETLRIASEKGAYTISDRATFVSLRSDLESVVLVEGDTELLNQYAVIVTNQELHPAVDSAGARQFSDWIISEQTQKKIGEFTKSGEVLFHPLRGECVLG